MSNRIVTIDQAFQTTSYAAPFQVGEGYAPANKRVSIKALLGRASAGGTVSFHVRDSAEPATDLLRLDRTEGPSIVTVGALAPGGADRVLLYYASVDIPGATQAYVGYVVEEDIDLAAVPLPQSVIDQQVFRDHRGRRCVYSTAGATSIQGFDWTTWLGDETIAQSVWTSDGVTLGTSEVNAGTVTTYVTGVNGYIANYVTTSTGRRSPERRLYLVQDYVF